MPRGNQLTEFEKGQIIILKGEGKNWSEIGRIINRTDKVCKAYFENPQNYGKNNSHGRPPLLKNRTKNLILRKASNEMVSAAKIEEELNLNVSPKTVLRAMNKSPNLRFAKMFKKS